MGENESDSHREYREQEKKENIKNAGLYLLIFIGVPGFGTWKWNWTEFDAALSVFIGIVLLGIHEKTKKYSKD